MCARLMDSVKTKLDQASKQIDQTGVRAFTRNGHDWTAQYRPVVDATRRLHCSRAIIDGEMIVQDEDGRSDFNSLRLAIGRNPERLVFMAFDCLHADGTNLRSLPLEQRRDAMRRTDARELAPRASCRGTARRTPSASRTSSYSHPISPSVFCTDRRLPAP